VVLEKVHPTAPSVVLDAADPEGAFGHCPAEAALIVTPVMSGFAQVPLATGMLQ
jgi:hypothetical protein